MAGGASALGLATPPAVRFPSKAAPSAAPTTLDAPPRGGADTITLSTRARLEQAGSRSPDLSMATASANLDRLQREILKPLGDGTPQQNAQVAPLLAGGDKALEAKLAAKGGLVRAVILSRVDAEAKKLQSQGKHVDTFELYRQEALGAFSDMDKVKIALTPDQVALRNNIQSFNANQAAFRNAQGR